MIREHLKWIFILQIIVLPISSEVSSTFSAHTIFVHFFSLKKWKKQIFVLERAQVIYSDKEYVDFNLRVDKINKTSYAINLNFTILKDLPPTSVLIELYAEYSNEYKIMPLTIKVSICEFFETYMKWITPEKVDAHLPNNGTIKKVRDNIKFI